MASAIDSSNTRDSSAGWSVSSANLPSPDPRLQAHDARPEQSPVTTPPYWSKKGRPHHERKISTVSNDSLPAGAITLRDNEGDEGDDRNNACWARSVEIIDTTVVNGNAANIGAFVVYIIKVETLTVSSTSESWENMAD
jgi:hypothetical protein